MSLYNANYAKSYCEIGLAEQREKQNIISKIKRLYAQFVTKIIMLDLHLLKVQLLKPLSVGTSL